MRGFQELTEGGICLDNGYGFGILARCGYEWENYIYWLYLDLDAGC